MTDLDKNALDTAVRAGCEAANGPCSVCPHPSVDCRGELCVAIPAAITAYLATRREQGVAEFTMALVARLESECVALRIALGAAIEEEREACARLAETFFAPAHTYASENADIYHAQDDAQRRIATKIRARSDVPKGKSKLNVASLRAALTKPRGENP